MNIPYYIFAWIASLAYASETVISKWGSKVGMKNLWMFNFFWNLFLCLGTVLISLYYGAGVPNAWGNIIVAGALYALSGALFVYLIYKIDVSVLTPLFSIRNAFAVFFAALLVHEVLTIRQLILIGVIFIFGIFASLDEKWSLKAFFTKNIFIAIIFMACLALEAVFVKKAIAQTNFWETTMWIVIIAQILYLPTIPLFKKDIKTLTLGQINLTLVTALGGIIGTIAVNKAFAVNVGISSVVVSLPISMVAVVIFSYFKPDLLEKHTLRIYIIRFTSAAIMIAAALKLS